MNNPGDYTEANAWQYTWTPAQHDVPGMMKAMGGPAAFTAQLEKFFTLQTPNPDKHLGQEALIGQYAHGNEVSHHIAYLFGFTPAKQKGRSILADIYQRFYKNTPDGLLGNDDCGAMSSWYLFTTLGFYPVDPAMGTYVIGAPQVAKAVMALPGGKTFTVTRAKEAWTQVYLNGKLQTKPELTHAQILAGGELTFK
jgi:predicted alpha-1,2-mannosidase